MRLAASAGYDPYGYVHYLQRLQGQGQGNLFSTHPGSAERVQRLASLIQRESLGHGQVNRERFQATVFAGRQRTGGTGQPAAPGQ